MTLPPRVMWLSGDACACKQTRDMSTWHPVVKVNEVNIRDTARALLLKGLGSIKWAHLRIGGTSCTGPGGLRLAR